MLLFREFIPIMNFSTGRRIVVYNRLQPLAKKHKFSRLRAHLSRAIEHDRRTRELENYWSSRKSGAVYADKLTAIDQIVDSMLSGFRDVAQGQARGLPADDPVVKQVESFMAEVFPHGVAAITTLPYIDQVAAVEVIVAKMSGDLAEVVHDLGLDRKFQRFVAIAAEYRRLVDLGRNDVDFASVRRARDRGQLYLREIIAMILGELCDSDNREHVATREELMAPIRDQQEALRAKARVRRNGAAQPGDDQPDDVPPGDDFPDDGQDDVVIAEAGGATEPESQSQSGDDDDSAAAKVE